MRIDELAFDRWEQEGIERICARSAQISKLRGQIISLVKQARCVQTDTNAEMTGILMFRLYEARWMLRRLRETLRAARASRVGASAAALSR